MINIEEISQNAMEIITYAGVAKSNYLEALEDYRKGNKEDALNKMESGSKVFTIAHEFHAKALTDEMQKLEPQVSLLLIHAEDQLMNAETIKILVKELMKMYDEKG